MILPIYTYGQPVLRKEAQDITADYPELKQFVENMWETLADSEGIGLAAPQVGRDIRVVVIDLDVISEDLSIRTSVRCSIMLISWNMMILRLILLRKDASLSLLFMRRWFALSVFM